MIGEDGAFVGAAVVIDVFKDEDFIVHLFFGFPVRI